MPPLLLKLVLKRMGPLGLPARRFADGQIATHLDYMEGELARSPWFAGEAFTAADVQMSFPVEAAAARGGLTADRPALWDFLQRIRARAGYVRAVVAGGPYDLLG